MKKSSMKNLTFVLLGATSLLVKASPALEKEKDEEVVGGGGGMPGLADQRALMEEMSENPLGKNPFFVRTMADRFTGEGKEGLEPAATPYFCMWLGNLDCGEEDKEFELTCEGAGSIDCTGDCPGDEAALKDMIDKTQDAEFLSQYPLLNKMLSQNRTKEESDQAKEAMVKMLSGCKGMEDYAVLIQVSDSIDFGGGGGEDDSDPDSILYVAEEAEAGWGDYEAGDDDDDYYGYDYDDEEEEEEKGKEGRNMDIQEEEGDEKTEGEDSSSSSVDRSSRQTPSSSSSLSRVPRISDQRSRREEERGGGGVIQRGEGEGFSHWQLRRMAEEVKRLGADLREVLGRVPYSSSEGEDKEEKGLEGLAKSMEPELRRRVERSLSATESDSGAGEEDKSGGGGGEMDKTAGPRKCVARNITCVEFPTTAQCKGIAVGGCFNLVKSLAMILNPRIVFASVMVIIAGAVSMGALAYYFIRKRYMGAVAPVGNGSVPEATPDDGGPDGAEDQVGGGGGGGGGEQQQQQQDGGGHVIVVQGEGEKKEEEGEEAGGNGGGDEVRPF